MATYSRTRSGSRWDSAFADFDAALAAASALTDHPAGMVREQVFDLLRSSSDEIFSIAAPTLGGIARKLAIYWGDSLWEEGPKSDWRRTIAGDIRRLERIAAGITEPAASGGMDLDKIASDWNEAFQRYELCAQSDESSESLTIRDQDAAEAHLLSLSAPTLRAVIRKLEIFWEDNWYDPIFDSSDHLLILRDLRRFAAPLHP